MWRNVLCAILGYSTTRADRRAAVTRPSTCGSQWRIACDGSCDGGYQWVTGAMRRMQYSGDAGRPSHLCYSVTITDRHAAVASDAGPWNHPAVVCHNGEIAYDERCDGGYQRVTGATGHGRFSIHLTEGVSGGRFLCTAHGG